MQISKLMKKDPVSVAPGDSIEQAAMMMKQEECGALPVTESEQSRKPIAMLTDRDIVLRCIAAGRDPRMMTVSECASEPLVCCEEDCSAEEAFHSMRARDIGRLPVIDKKGELIGIVSLADLIARVPREVWSQLPGAEQARPRQAA